jgi:hypothetical protein
VQRDIILEGNATDSTRTARKADKVGSQLTATLRLVTSHLDLWIALSSAALRQGLAIAPDDEGAPARFAVRTHSDHEKSFNT